MPSLVLSGILLGTGGLTGTLLHRAAGLSPVALAVASAGGFAVVTLVGSRPLPGLGALDTIGFAFTVGGLVLFPVAGRTAGLGFQPSPTALVLMLALGIGPTAVAYTLYFQGL